MTMNNNNENKNRIRPGSLYRVRIYDTHVIQEYYEMFIETKKLTLEERNERWLSKDRYEHKFLNGDGEFVEISSTTENFEEDLIWGKVYERIDL
jgi:hypothetical protein